MKPLTKMECTGKGSGAQGLEQIRAVFCGWENSGRPSTQCRSQAREEAEDPSGCDWSAKVFPRDGHPSWVGVCQEGCEESFQEGGAVAAAHGTHRKGMAFWSSTKLLADGNWDGQKGEVPDGMCNLESLGGRSWVLCPSVIIFFQNGERNLEG